MHAFLALVFPVILAGDWNSQPGVPNMDSCVIEIWCLAAGRNMHIAMPSAPTWRNKVYDFFLVSPQLYSSLLDAHTLQPKLFEHLRDLLPSDHHLVTWTLKWARLTKKHGYIRRFHTAKWTVNMAVLDTSLSAPSARRSSSAWDELWHLARCSQRRLPSKKYVAQYVDSPALQDSGRHRNTTLDPILRASLSRQIIRGRRAAKQQWALDLREVAAAGDAASIAFLDSRPMSNWHPLIQSHDGQEAAAQMVHSHFTAVFPGAPQEQRDLECKPHFGLLSTRKAACAPVIEQSELHTALAKLKLGKTSGAAGMSNEFLCAIAQRDAGEQLLLEALFLHGEFRPDIMRGVACLIPKLRQATAVSDIRPILVLEVLQIFFGQHPDGTPSSLMASTVCSSWGCAGRPGHRGIVCSTQHDKCRQGHRQELRLC